MTAASNIDDFNKMMDESEIFFISSSYYISYIRFTGSMAKKDSIDLSARVDSVKNGLNEVKSELQKLIKEFEHESSKKKG